MAKSVLFCGLTTVDIQYFVDQFPHPNQKIKTGKPDIYVGGPAANAALTHAFLGGESLFVTGIGNNHFSNFMLSDLNNHRVKVIDAAENTDFSPIIASIITSVHNGDRSVISHFPPIISNLPENIDIDFNNIQMVVIDGFYPEISLEICRKANQHKIPVLFDGGSWKPYTLELLNFVDMAICSEQFLPNGCMTPNDTIKFLKINGINNIAITRGEKDIIFSSPNGCQNIEIKPALAADSLGAGDIFHGAFARYFSLNNQFEDALRKAAVIASFSTQFKGTRKWMDYYSENILTNPESIQELH